MISRLQLYRWACTLLVLLSLVACAPLRPALLQPGFAETPCPFESIRAVTCGILTVPADRAQPLTDSNRVQMVVARYHSRADQPTPDPLVYLGGGPGEWSIDRMEQGGLDVLNDVLAERDVIVVDQRGTGFSRPLLDCTSLRNFSADQVAATPDEDTPMPTWYDAIQSCADDLRQAGVSLSTYSSAASAADLDDLRRLMGYERWNLYGVSYGGRLALTIMRDYGGGVRSVILDSALPLHVDSYAESAQNMAVALAQVLATCAAQPACDAAFPELATILPGLIERLNTSPLSIELIHPDTREPVTMTVDGHWLLALVRDGLSDPQRLPLVPGLIMDVEAGNTDSLPRLLRDSLVWNEYFSDLVFYAVSCADEWLFTTDDTVRIHTAQLPDHIAPPALSDLRQLQELCTALGIAPPAARENEAVESSIPTLILAGSFDPITPAHWSRQLGTMLSRSQYFEFSSLGHGVLWGSACARQSAAHFLQAPTRPLTIECPALQQPPRYQTR